MHALLLAVALAAQLEAMHERLEQHAVEIYQSTGANAFEYSGRTLQLADFVREAQADPKLDARTQADVQTEGQLELSLDRDLLSGTFRPLSAVPGASVVLLRMPKGLPPEPVALYFPRNYSSQSVHPLVLMLHGAGEPETDIVSRYQFQSLADANGAVIVAPWAEGSKTFDGPAPAEIFAALDAVQRFVRTDPRRTYIAGISMGGAGAFHIALLARGRFDAVLSIIGDLNPRDVPGMRLPFARLPVYVVNGGHDPIMTPAVLQYTMQALGDIDEYASFYLAPNAGHSIVQAGRQVAQAWNDMMNGTTRSYEQNVNVLQAVLHLRPPPDSNLKP